MEKIEAKHFIYNYDDTLYCVYVEDMRDRVCEQMVDEHMLCYIISGEMTLLKHGRQILKVHKGEALLVRRNHLINKIDQYTPVLVCDLMLSTLRFDAKRRPI
jgi:mannose-6-phosphate isomerase class I